MGEGWRKEKVLSRYKSAPLIEVLLMKLEKGDEIILDKEGTLRSNVSSAYLFWSCVHSDATLKTTEI